MKLFDNFFLDIRDPGSFRRRLEDIRGDGKVKVQVYSHKWGEWGTFRNLSNSDKFDKDQSEEIETRGKLSHHRIMVHAYMIHKSEEHAIT